MKAMSARKGLKIVYLTALVLAAVAFIKLTAPVPGVVGAAPPTDSAFAVYPLAANYGSIVFPLLGVFGLLIGGVTLVAVLGISAIN